MPQSDFHHQATILRKQGVISTMRLSFPVSAVMLSLSLLSSQAKAQQQPATGSVHGHAILQDTGKPATGAGVSLLPVADVQPSPQIPDEGEYLVRDQPQRGDFHSTVDASGSFAIEHVLPGNYTILTYMPGYVSQDASQPSGTPSKGSARQKVHVLPGERAFADVQLERGGAIEGTVAFTDGKPVHTGKGIYDEVAVNLEMMTDTGKFSRFGGAAHTDEQGYYRFDALPAAKYIVFTALPGGTVSTVRGTSATTGMLLYAPSTVRTTQAQIVELHGLEVRKGIDIEVPTTGLHTVSGKIIERTGQPVLEGIVRIFPKGEPDLSRAVPLDKDGQFSFDNVPDEQYTVTAEFPGQTEFLGVTDDKTTIRLRRHKPPFTTATMDVLVAGQNPAALVLIVDSTH
jgi:hypothetical protein